MKSGFSLNPWNLETGDYSRIGEYAWLDSLAPIKIGSHCCISQGTYFCTGQTNCLMLDL